MSVKLRASNYDLIRVILYLNYLNNKIYVI